ncbi:unnamed protein product [Rotaria sp. Silwood2]|nr:unnamed protein product [Rotaria sp. Silwood2]CAF4189754.1 unnamed protein product [Rotaria sp. Silwood2]
MNFDLKWNIGWSSDARNFHRTPYVERSQHKKQKILDVLNLIAYHRRIFDNLQIAVIHNFSNLGYTYYDIPLLESDPNVGHIRNVVEIFNIDDLKYGGSSTFQNQWIEIKRNNGQDIIFTIALSPLSTIVIIRRKFSIIN